MMDELKIDYKKVAEQLRNGDALFGRDGALAPMLERILNAALEGEMDSHLSEASRESGNRRNGKMPEQVQTKYGEVTVETPRNRDGSFTPQTVKKRETILAGGMADRIIGMYAFGTSTARSAAILKKSSTQGCPQRPSVLLPTAYFQRFKSGNHVCWSPCMPSAGLTPFITR